MNDGAAGGFRAQQATGGLASTAAHDARRLEIWRNCFLTFEFSTGSSQWTAATTPITEMPTGLSSWLTMTLGSERYQFDLLLPLEFFDVALRKEHPSVNIHGLEEADRLLVIEQLLSDPLHQLENLLGTYQNITSVRVSAQRDVQTNSLQFSIDNRESRFVGFLNIADPLAERITERVMPYSSVDEKTVSDELGIMIGPIALNNQAFSNITVGGIIDCGVQPNDTIRGFVLRSDQRYWPGFVEDTQFLVSSTHQPLDFTAARKAGKTLVSLQFANANVSAIDRLGLTEGDRINISRFEGNDVRIFANDIEHAYGHLLVHNGNLAVEVRYLKEQA